MKVNVYDPETKEFLREHICQICPKTKEFMKPSHCTDIEVPYFEDGVVIFFNDNSWLVDIEKTKSNLLKQLDIKHEDTLINTTGNPTAIERDTWKYKIELSQAILDKSQLSNSQKVFLETLELKTVQEQISFAKKVISKSESFYNSVAFLDKFKSDVKTKIKSSSTIDEFNILVIKIKIGVDKC